MKADGQPGKCFSEKILCPDVIGQGTLIFRQYFLIYKMNRLLLLLIVIFAANCVRQNPSANIKTADSPAPSSRAPETPATPVPQTTPVMRHLPPPVLRVLSKIKGLQQQGIAMQPLRNKNDSQISAQCESLMKKYQKAALDLGERSETLPGPYSLYLGLASIELETCVSCESDAQESCEKMNDTIGGMYK